MSTRISGDEETKRKLKEALKGIDETATEAAYLKAKVTEDLIDSVTDGSFTDAYSY